MQKTEQKFTVKSQKKRKTTTVPVLPKNFSSGKNESCFLGETATIVVLHF